MKITNSHITVGVDEVGRGPWAGPLLVSAVALDMSQTYCGLDDSKKLTKKRRSAMAIYIKQRALGVGLGWVDVNELDQLGMTKSLKLGARRAFSQLPIGVQTDAAQIVIDGNILMLDDSRAIAMIKADAKVQAVSAASIVAKVSRDSYMAQLDRVFPGYGFAKHAGYGTKQHLEALGQLGVIRGVHRSSFAPIKQLLGDDTDNQSVRPVEQTAGRIAEGVAAEYLASCGFTIVERNWKTKLCEIDIVAVKDKTIYFVEVKYRSNNACGDGVEAITARKQKQMRFAAEIYMHDHPETNRGYSPALLAVSLSGRSPAVDQLIDVDY